MGMVAEYVVSIGEQVVGFNKLKDNSRQQSERDCVEKNSLVVLSRLKMEFPLETGPELI